MKMGPFKFLTILTSHIKTDSRVLKALSKALHKPLIVTIVKRPVRRTMVIIIGKSNEAVLLMETGFMHTANRPLAATLKATPTTLTTW
jgi:hypothetical protein